MGFGDTVAPRQRQVNAERCEENIFAALTSHTERVHGMPACIELTTTLTFRNLCGGLADHCQVCQHPALAVQEDPYFDTRTDLGIHGRRGRQ